MARAISRFSKRFLQRPVSHTADNNHEEGSHMQTTSEERYGADYLEERRITPRWSATLTHVVNVVALLAVFYASWWIFQDPRGIYRLYTPYVGYMYTRWWLIILIW